MPELIDPFASSVDPQEYPVTPQFLGPIEEWHIIVQSRANVLIIGDNCHLEQTFFALEPYLRGEVIRWNREELPPVPSGSAVLLVRNLDEMTSGQVVELEAWLQEVGLGVQVLSCGSEDIFASVTSGLFPTSLYYRLNTIVLEAQPLKRSLSD